MIVSGRVICRTIREAHLCAHGNTRRPCSRLCDSFCNKSQTDENDGPGADTLMTHGTENLYIDMNDEWKEAYDEIRETPGYSPPRQLIQYEWGIPIKKWNKLMKALHGNTTTGDSGPRRGPSRAARQGRKPYNLNEEEEQGTPLGEILRRNLDGLSRKQARPELGTTPRDLSKYSLTLT